MALSRTTADYVSAVLRKCGESTTGTSQLTDNAVEYLNKVHTDVISGGTIFDLDVDDNFVWAMDPNPFVITLQPKYNIGTATLTTDATIGAFSSAPTVSLEGWHIRISGEYTTYRIMSHVANATAFSIDSAYVGTTGSYSHTTFKLDYDITPEQIYIKSGVNDRIDFIESGTTQLTATLTAGTYTPSGLATQIATQLNATGTHGNLYSASYSATTRLFTIASNLAGTGTPLFSILAVSGTNASRSAMPGLGFDDLDLTGATATGYVSVYPLGSISRLVGPLTFYQGQSYNPYIEGIDPITMQEDYPVGDALEGVPSRFAIISEDAKGAFKIRLDRYPAQEVKIEIPHVLAPRDLQNNSISVPLIPRKYSDILEYGASFFLALDKNDDKASGFMGLAKAMLQTMQKHNRAVLRRISPNFAEIIPRRDLGGQYKRPNYGYTSSGSSAPAPSGATTPTMFQVTLSYAQFQTAALTNTLLVRTLPANYTLFAIIIKHNQAFVGTSITQLHLDVGIAGDVSKFITQFDVLQAVSSTAQDSQLVLYYPGTITDINVKATAVGANLSALTAGSVDIFLQELVTG